jgi:hypothetical protein
MGAVSSQSCCQGNAQKVVCALDAPLTALAEPAPKWIYMGCAQKGRVGF